MQEPWGALPAETSCTFEGLEAQDSAGSDRYQPYGVGLRPRARKAANGEQVESAAAGLWTPHATGGAAASAYRSRVDRSRPRARRTRGARLRPFPFAERRPLLAGLRFLPARRPPLDTCPYPRRRRGRRARRTRPRDRRHGRSGRLTRAGRHDRRCLARLRTRGRSRDPLRPRVGHHCSGIVRAVHHGRPATGSANLVLEAPDPKPRPEVDGGRQHRLLGRCRAEQHAHRARGDPRRRRSGRHAARHALEARPLRQRVVPPADGRRPRTAAAVHDRPVGQHRDLHRRAADRRCAFVLDGRVHDEQPRRRTRMPATPSPSASTPASRSPRART